MWRHRLLIGQEKSFSRCKWMGREGFKVDNEWIFWKLEKFFEADQDDLMCCRHFGCLRKEKRHSMEGTFHQTQTWPTSSTFMTATKPNEGSIAIVDWLPVPENFESFLVSNFWGNNEGDRGSSKFHEIYLRPLHSLKKKFHCDVSTIVVLTDLILPSTLPFTSPYWSLTYLQLLLYCRTQIFLASYKFLVSVAMKIPPLANSTLMEFA